jgi:hypothetical protein
MTVSALPSELSPAVRANGTVKPSEKPRVKSERKRVKYGLLDLDIVTRWSKQQLALVRDGLLECWIEKPNAQFEVEVQNMQRFENKECLEGEVFGQRNTLMLPMVSRWGSREDSSCRQFASGGMKLGNSQWWTKRIMHEI